MLTLAEFAERKQLPVSFLRDQLIGDSDEGLRFPYFDAEGHFMVAKFRPSWGEFRWPVGSRLIPYGLWHKFAVHARGLLLVEGESDALTLWSCGIPTLGIPGSSVWRDEWKVYLARARPIVVVEPDVGGVTFLRRLADSLGGVWWVECPGYKDVSDMYVALGPDAFTGQMQRLIADPSYAQRSTFTPLRSSTRATGEESCLEIARQAGVQLKQKGAEWWGLCPFHEETKASFHIHPGKNQWKCFGCGRGGGPVALKAALAERN